MEFPGTPRVAFGHQRAYFGYDQSSRGQYRASTGLDVKSPRTLSQEYEYGLPNVNE